jgi:hypothetical protein
MKRVAVIAPIFLALGMLVWSVAQVAPVGRPLASLFPAGASLYLEAGDFQALLKDWNQSREKRVWLTSANYEVFSRSNLYLKLQNAQAEFGKAAGIIPNMDLAAGLSGGASGLAIYDIGNLEFLYITRMPAARFAATALWNSRASYTPRSSMGLDYYVRVDPASRRVAAFAVAKDYLFLATREDALAGALALLSGAQAPNVAAELWFNRSVEAAHAPGELRLALNMPRLLASPYMRSYWIARNASELKQYAAALSDIRRTGTEFSESRILLRDLDQPPSSNEAAVAQVLRLAPASAGFYRAWASPTAAQAAELVASRIFEPTRETATRRRAPEAPKLDGAVGGEADLETRIDEPPLDIETRSASAALLGVFGAAPIEAMLQVSGSRVLPDGVFVGVDHCVALIAASDWDAARVRTALANAGELEGLGAVAFAANGRTLLIATRAEALEPVLALMSNPPAQTVARYAAFYRHSRELPNFIKLTRLIDNPLRSEGPPFFSGNLASLGATLDRLDTVSISVHDTGAVVEQTVTYRLKP